MYNSTIKTRYGVCNECTDNKPKPLIGGKCQYHYWQGKSRLPTAIKQAKPKPPKPPKPKQKTKIKRRSAKRAAQERLYSTTTRPEYLAEHPICEHCIAVDATNKLPADQIHHKKGRIGALLNDKRHFLAVADPCHKWIEAHPDEAKALGLSSSRLNENET